MASTSYVLGRETARRHLEAGVRVTIWARSQTPLAETRDELAAKTGGEVHAVVADMAVEADVERLVHDAAGRFGGVDILVNNAGTMYSSRAAA